MIEHDSNAEANGAGPYPPDAGGTRQTSVKKALSIRAPWWWFILYAGKDIENRDWYTGYRGTVLLHASKWFGKQEVYDDFQDAREFAGLNDLRSATLGEMRGLGGHIVGSVEIVDCVRQSKSPWFFGKFGFVLRNPVAFDKPWPVKGALGFFDCSQAQSDRG